MIKHRHLFCIFILVWPLLAHSNQAIELEFLTPTNLQILLSGTNYDIRWPSRQRGTTNLTLMRMVSDRSMGGSILEIASNVALSSGEYKWTIPPGLDINNVHFPPWAILSDCKGTQKLSGAFWVNDVAIYKRNDGNSIDKTTRYPNGSRSSDANVSTSSIGTGIGSGSDSPAKVGMTEASTTTTGSSDISSLLSASDIATSTLNSWISHTSPTLLATSTNTPSASDVKKNHMPMIVGIVVGVLGSFVLTIVFIIIRYRDKDGETLTSPWKIRGDKNALELDTTVNLHEIDGPGKFELDGTSMKKVYELEGKSIKNNISADVGD